MTARLPFTQASVRRAIAAARKEGLKVTEIRPDGTLVVTVDDGDNSPSPVVDRHDSNSKWASAKQ